MKTTLPIILLLLFFSCSKKTEKENTVDRNWELRQYIGYQFYNQTLRNQELYNNLLTLKDSSVVKDIQKVNQETIDLLTFLSNTDSKIFKNTGGMVVESGVMKNPEDKDYIENNFIINNETADEINKRINDYYNFIKSKGFISSKIAPYGKEHPIYIKDKRFNEKGFGYLYFKDASAIQASINLLLMQFEIVNYEQMYYEKILLDHRKK